MVVAGRSARHERWVRLLVEARQDDAGGRERAGRSVRRRIVVRMSPVCAAATFGFKETQRERLHLHVGPPLSVVSTSRVLFHMPLAFTRSVMFPCPHDDGWNPCCRNPNRLVRLTSAASQNEVMPASADDSSSDRHFRTSANQSVELCGLHHRRSVRQVSGYICAAASLE